MDSVKGVLTEGDCLHDNKPKRSNKKPIAPPPKPTKQ